jgi:hypothetical protein
MFMPDRFSNLRWAIISLSCVANAEVVSMGIPWVLFTSMPFARVMPRNFDGGGFLADFVEAHPKIRKGTSKSMIRAFIVFMTHPLII